MRSIGIPRALSGLIVSTSMLSLGLVACGDDTGPNNPNNSFNPAVTPSDSSQTGTGVAPSAVNPVSTLSPTTTSVNPVNPVSPQVQPSTPAPSTAPVNPQVQPTNVSPTPTVSPVNPGSTMDDATSMDTVDTTAPMSTDDETAPTDDSNADPSDDSMGMMSDDTVDTTMMGSDDTADGMDTSSDMSMDPGTDGPAPAEPSEGCGKQGSQTGSSGAPLTLGGQFSQQYYVKLPNNYDANTPYRLLFMFNPTGNPINWAEQNAGFEAIAANDLIRVYPHPSNSNNGWNGSDVPFFQPLYDKVTQDYCVDKARVFAAGESSGGDYAGILGCEHADKIRAIGPCATKPVSAPYTLDANSRNCSGQVSAVVIHGKNDNVVGTENGPRMRDFYSQLNNCTSMSMPVEGFTDNLSNCVEYQGCDEGYPVIWCQHEDPEYSGTNHGWPKFAARMLWEHFQSF